MIGSSDKYPEDAKSHLHRARQRLADGSRQSLFYVAFELRCAVEARIHEYFKVNQKVTRLRGKGWRVSKLAKQIDAAFRTGEQLVQVTILDASTDKSIVELWYTPVTKKLIKMNEKIGQYLHFMPKPTEKSDLWWSNFRRVLDSIADEVVSRLRVDY